LEGIQASGGMLYEAIEVALWHANREILQEYEDADGIPPSQIFIIGDAPPNRNIDAINTKKKYRGLQDWKPIEKSKKNFEEHGKWNEEEANKRFGKFNSNWEAELKKITTKGIPIYTYYIEEVSIKNMGEEDKKTWIKELKETFLTMAVNEGTSERLSF
jgi:hypothetical protein